MSSFNRLRIRPSIFRILGLLFALGWGVPAIPAQAPVGPECSELFREFVRKPRIYGSSTLAPEEKLDLIQDSLSQILGLPSEQRATQRLREVAAQKIKPGPFLYREAVELVNLLLDHYDGLGQANEFLERTLSSLREGILDRVDPWLGHKRASGALFESEDFGEIFEYLVSTGKVLKPQLLDRVKLAWASRETVLVYAKIAKSILVTLVCQGLGIPYVSLPDIQITRWAANKPSAVEIWRAKALKQAFVYHASLIAGLHVSYRVLRQVYLAVIASATLSFITTDLDTIRIGWRALSDLAMHSIVSPADIREYAKKNRDEATAIQNQIDAWLEAAASPPSAQEIETYRRELMSLEEDSQISGLPKINSN